MSFARAALQCTRSLGLEKLTYQQHLKRAVLMQHYVPSQDGEVQIPLLILTQKEMSTAPNTSYPTLLYSYGGEQLPSLADGNQNCGRPYYYTH